MFGVFYIGDARLLYGTAYGVRVAAKIVLLALGFANFKVTERLRRKHAAPLPRLRRFAEVEIGAGFTIFFAAASLTSLPPALDLAGDRVGWHAIAARYAPAWPRLTSDHDQLALVRLQTRLDRAATQTHRVATLASVPGSDDPPPRNAHDIAWSEYNHHWAGVFVLTIGLLALLHRAGIGWLRHWPLPVSRSMKSRLPAASSGSKRVSTGVIFRPHRNPASDGRCAGWRCASTNATAHRRSRADSRAGRTGRNRNAAHAR